MKNQSSRISLKKRNNKEQPVNPSCISRLSSGGGAFLHHTAAVEGTSWLFRLYPTALKSFASIWSGYVGACCTGVYWLLYFMHGWLREMQSVLADGDSRSLPELAYIVICCLKVTCFSYPFSDVWFLSGLQTDEGKCINLQKIKQLALCLWASTKFWKTPKYWVLVFY